jgi:hypothetical protein
MLVLETGLTAPSTQRSRAAHITFVNDLDGEILEPYSTSYDVPVYTRTRKEPQPTLAIGGETAAWGVETRTATTAIATSLHASYSTIETSVRAGLRVDDDRDAWTSTPGTDMVITGGSGSTSGYDIFEDVLLANGVENRFNPNVLSRTRDATKGNVLIGLMPILTPIELVTPDTMLQLTADRVTAFEYMPVKVDGNETLDDRVTVENATLCNFILCTGTLNSARLLHNWGVLTEEELSKLPIRNHPIGRVTVTGVSSVIGIPIDTHEARTEFGEFGRGIMAHPGNVLTGLVQAEGDRVIEYSFTPAPVDGVIVVTVTLRGGDFLNASLTPTSVSPSDSTALSTLDLEILTEAVNDMGTWLESYGTVTTQPFVSLGHSWHGTLVENTQVAKIKNLTVLDSSILPGPVDAPLWLTTAAYVNNLTVTMVENDTLLSLGLIMGVRTELPLCLIATGADLMVTSQDITKFHRRMNIGQQVSNTMQPVNARNMPNSTGVVVCGRSPDTVLLWWTATGEVSTLKGDIDATPLSQSQSQTRIEITHLRGLARPTLTCSIDGVLFVVCVGDKNVPNTAGLYMLDMDTVTITLEPPPATSVVFSLAPTLNVCKRVILDQSGPVICAAFGNSLAVLDRVSNTFTFYTSTTVEDDEIVDILQIDRQTLLLLVVNGGSVFAVVVDVGGNIRERTPLTTSADVTVTDDYYLKYRLCPVSNTPNTVFVVIPSDDQQSSAVLKLDLTGTVTVADVYNVPPSIGIVRDINVRDHTGDVVLVTLPVGETNSYGVVLTDWSKTGGVNDDPDRITSTRLFFDNGGTCSCMITSSLTPILLTNKIS